MDNLLSIDYKDWFINQKRIPDKESSEAKEFFEFHKKLCTEGCLMNGEFINPFLMWHLNFWHTEVDVIDEKGYISQKYINPPLRDNEWIITNAIDSANKERKGLVIAGSRRIAKALRNDEVLYKENEEIQIGNVNVGDKIYDHNGKLTTVTGVFPQGKVPIYKITFEDNREIYCCKDHIWRVKDKRTNVLSDITTERLLTVYKRERRHNGYKDKETHFIYEKYFAIPNNKSVNYPHRGLKIDPYFLGLWLGDGTSKATHITTYDDEIIDYIDNYASSLGLSVVKHKHVSKVSSGRRGGKRGKNTLLNYLNEYNLIANKHIPFDYLHSSTEQRFELLQGLMDTDGSVTKNGGNITYVTTSEQLAKDFHTLCRSLGINLRKQEIRTLLYGKDCGKGWRFTLYTELPIFKLTRKAELIKVNVEGKQFKINWTTIKNIERVDDSEATCIMVDNSDSLFLTTGFTVTHNSTYEASYIGWGATFDENSQNVIAGLNSPDIKLITDKLDKGLNYIPWYYKWDRIEDNWKQQVSLGIKSKTGERYPFSYILIRNLDDGNNEEAIAGTKPRKLIIDEGAKGLFLRALMAAIPGFTTPYGWGCSPIVTFTGGDARKFNDAKQLMFDGASFNFLEFTDQKDSSKKHGLFMGHKYRLEAKIQSSLGEYINNPSLVNVPMMVADEEKADKITDEILERTKKSSDRATYLKEKMYYPKTVDDIFLNEDTNIFDVELAKRQKARLLSEGHTGTPVTLHLDENGNVYHKFTDKSPITNFPLKPSDNKDAPIVIYEFPIENPPYGLYVSGVDSYRVMKAAYSDSLGSIYIYKRMTSIIGESYQDMLVASYAARPDKKETWNEQARLLIKYYNARTLVENDEISFIDYMISKGDARYLEPQPAWMREIVPNSTVNRDYGIHRSAEKIRDFLHECLKKYMEEVIYVEKDEEGHIIKEVLGVSRIQDVMLLEEIIQFTEDGNFDRIVSSELAIALAMKLDPLLGVVGEGTRTKASYIKREKPPLFVGAKNTFSKNRQRLFT